MKPVVLTNIHTAARIARSGLLKYFSPQEFRFLISDLGYEHKYPITAYNQHDRVFAERMRKQGFLQVSSFVEPQMRRLFELFSYYKPKFTIRIVSALLLAEVTNATLLTEDVVVQDAAISAMISTQTKQWLVTEIIHELAFQGITLDIELVSELI